MRARQLGLDGSGRSSTVSLARAHRAAQFLGVPEVQQKLKLMNVQEIFGIAGCGDQQDLVMQPAAGEYEHFNAAAQPQASLVKRLCLELRRM